MNLCIKKLKYFEKTMEDKIQKAVMDITLDIMKENEELKKENANLKKILNMDSSNSGIPTSKTPINKDKRIPNSREKSDKPKGGQKGHKKHKLEKFKDDEITDTYFHDLENKQCNCGGHLVLVDKRYKDEFDISVRLMKIRHEFGDYECDCCYKKISVPIPNNLKEENQYGKGAQAMALSLVNEGYVSFHRTKELVSGFTGGQMNMSEGYIAKLQKIARIISEVDMLQSFSIVSDNYKFVRIGLPNVTLTDDDDDETTINQATVTNYLFGEDGYIEIDNNVENSFELVIWLHDDGCIQDTEQGRNFAGTINVSVDSSDNTSSGGKVTGQRG